MDDVRKSRWQVPNALRIIALFLGAVVLLLFLWRARSLALTAFLAVIAGLAVARAADWLEKHKVKRGVGAPLTMFLVVGAVVGLIAMIAPTVREQTGDLAKELPRTLQLVEKKLGMSKGTLTSAPQQQQQQQQQPPQQQPQTQTQGKPQQQQQQSGLKAMVQREMRSIGRLLFPVIASTFEAAAGLLILIFIAIYIGISPGTYRAGIIHLVPHAHRGKADLILGELSETLRGWLTARLIAMVAIGIITGAGLALLNVKAALALGLIAGLLELVPFYGPVIAAIPAIGVALAESPQKAVWVALLYLLIQQIEGNLITPLILKKRLEIPPVLTIIGVSAFGIVFGVLGMLAAEPLIAATLVLVKRLYVKDVVGDDVD